MEHRDGRPALATTINGPGTMIEVLQAIFRTLNGLPAKQAVLDSDLQHILVPCPSTEYSVRAGFALIIREGLGEE